jgi:glycerol-3-phosphate dehydrogenase
MVFAIPRGKVTYIGTTDTNYKGNLDRITVSKEDVQYLTNAVNNTFPSISLTENDIVSSWAGLRPLIHEDGKSPSELSRKDEIFISDTNLISIAGGKLTGYRKMAQRIVDLVNKNLDHAFNPCITKEIALTQSPLKSTKAVDEYLKKLEKQLAAVGLEPYYAWYLVTNYGQHSDLILQKMKEFEEEVSIALIRAELWYSIQYEMTNTLSDFYIRRTGRLFFDIESIHQTIQVIQQDMQTYLEWDDQRVKEELATLESHIYDATNFYEASVNTLIE